METAVMSMQTYQKLCKLSSIEPLPAFLDAIACGATAFTGNTLSPAHVEAIAGVLPDTTVRSICICHTKLSCSTWGVLIKGCSRAPWKRVSLQGCDLTALDQKSLANACGHLRVEQLGMKTICHK
jgi:hypothetical protein